MPDDAVVEVGDVHSAVGTELEVYGAEPGVVADDKVGLFFRDWSRAGPFDLVAVDAAGHRVADEEVVAELFGHAVIRPGETAGDGGRAVGVAHHGRSEAQ